MAKPTIHILAMGGTIAMVPDPHGGARPALSASDIIAVAPGIDDLANIHAHDFRSVASANLRFEDLIDLAKEVNICEIINARRRDSDIISRQGRPRAAVLVGHHGDRAAQGKDMNCRFGHYPSTGGAASGLQHLASRRIIMAEIPCRAPHRLSCPDKH